MSEYLNLLNLPEGTIPAEVTTYLADPATLIALALLTFAVAFFGFRIFKAVFPILFAATLAGVGLAYAPTLFETIGLSLDFIDLTVTVAVVLAILGLILGRYAYKFSLFVYVGYSAYLYAAATVAQMAAQNPDLTFLSNEIAAIAIAVVAAIIVAVLANFLFKLLYIVITSIGGMALCAVFVTDAVMTTMPAALIVLGAGAVIGIFAAVKQFKDSAKLYR